MKPTPWEMVKAVEVLRSGGAELVLRDQVGRVVTSYLSGDVSGDLELSVSLSPSSATSLVERGTPLVVIPFSAISATVEIRPECWVRVTEGLA